MANPFSFPMGAFGGLGGLPKNPYAMPATASPAMPNAVMSGIPAVPQMPRSGPFAGVMPMPPVMGVPPWMKNNMTGLGQYGMNGFIPPQSVRQQEGFLPRGGLYGAHQMSQPRPGLSLGALGGGALGSALGGLYGGRRGY